MASAKEYDDIRQTPDRTLWRRLKDLAFEFLRYVLVGGVAFVVDFATLVATYELFLDEFACGVYVATALGFVTGLAVNYALSLWFVFTQPQDLGKGRSWAAFAVFALVGLAGLGLTMLGMWFGVEVLDWNYRIVKVLVTGIVLGWNYLGRKILVFKAGL